MRVAHSYVYKNISINSQESHKAHNKSFTLTCSYLTEEHNTNVGNRIYTSIIMYNIQLKHRTYYALSFSFTTLKFL